jgi:hypothetical protein
MGPCLISGSETCRDPNLAYEMIKRNYRVYDKEVRNALSRLLIFANPFSSLPKALNLAIVGMYYCLQFLDVVKDLVIKD